MRLAGGTLAPRATGNRRHGVSVVNPRWAQAQQRCVVARRQLWWLRAEDDPVGGQLHLQPRDGRLHLVLRRLSAHDNRLRRADARRGSSA